MCHQRVIYTYHIRSNGKEEKNFSLLESRRFLLKDFYVKIERPEKVLKRGFVFYFDYTILYFTFLPFSSTLYPLRKGMCIS